MSTPEQMLAVLNRAFAADPVAMHALVINRVPCNHALADDPDVIVDCLGPEREGRWVVGLLGIVNGLLGAASPHRVAIRFEDYDDGPHMATGFVLVEAESVASGP